jgi:hypothetical protein
MASIYQLPRTTAFLEMLLTSFQYLLKRLLEEHVFARHFFFNEERVCSKCQESFAHLPSVTSQNKDSRGYTAVVTTDLAVNLLLKIGSLLDIRVVLGGPLLRHCATIRKVACLISTGIFH